MFIQRENGFLDNWGFLLGDIITIELALTIAFYLREQFGGDVTAGVLYPILGLMSAFFATGITFFSETYLDIRNRGNFLELVETVKLVTTVILFVLGILFMTKLSDYASRMVVHLWFWFAIFLSYIQRLYQKRHLNRIIALNDVRSIVLVVPKEADQEFIQKVKDKHKEASYRVVKVAALRPLSYSDPEILIGEEALKGYVLNNPVDELFFIDTEEKHLPDLMSELLVMGVSVHIDFDAVYGHLSHPTFNVIAGEKVITTSLKVGSERDLFFKRLIDIVGALVGLLITGIMMIFLVPIMKADSKGPIIFAQDRVGKNGKIFRFYKFRSMYIDAEERKTELMAQNEMSGLMFKIKDDPRITKVGRFIRKTSLDEFPQFWNVLKGDMSLVGTRPPTVDEYENYEPHHKARLAMRPGITGMWQASGRSDITDFEEVVRLDREYLNNWTLGLDFRLIFQTIVAVLNRKGAC